MMKGGGDSGNITVECLRSRLLAERAASKAAKDEADLMAKRLDELEKQVAEEIKFRDRAEKRLEYALKKLKSMKILHVVESSRGSFESWSVDSGTVEDSSGQCGSGGGMEEMRGELGVKVAGDDDSCLDSSNSWSKEEADQDDMQASAAGVEKSNVTVQNAENSNDRIAPVPVKITPVSYSAGRSDAGGGGAQDVLIALGQVKELLRSSMERRAAALPYPKHLYGQ